ncbi:MAG: stage II sporulation protein M [Armatimonadetes bacterium]|nr:stage II sporulation protein M [Armatimonadota bacterium]
MTSSRLPDLRFVRERQESWQRLSELVDRTQRVGLGGLSGDEVLELGRLYRRAASDLAYARTHLPDETVRRRLNDLVSRAHGALYHAERGGMRALLDFFWRDFPELLTRRRAFVLVATAVFLFGSIFALVRPDLSAGIIPESYDTPHLDPQDSPAAGSMITANNIQVALMGFAGGLPFGLLTLWILFSNGMMLGAVGALIERKGQSLEFWPSIVPHGILELSAIMIAGGAGLMIGWALLHPGDLSRGRALSVAAGEAVRLLAGTIPMFLIAGTIEGFISFSSLPAVVKLIVAALSAVGMAFYFTRKGDPGAHDRSSTGEWVKE